MASTERSASKDSDSSLHFGEMKFCAEKLDLGTGNAAVRFWSPDNLESCLSQDRRYVVIHGTLPSEEERKKILEEVGSD